MAKKYRLLRNWPEGEIGDIYQKAQGSYVNQNRISLPVSKEYVENYPYFFEEIVEKEFVWDDNLVIELLSSYAPFADNLYTIPKHIENFKELKSNSIKSGAGTANDVLNTEETIEDFWKRHDIKGMPITGGYYFIYNCVQCFGQVDTLPYTMRLKIRPSCIKDDIGRGAGEAVYKDFPRRRPTEYKKYLEREHPHKLEKKTPQNNKEERIEISHLQSRDYFGSTGHWYCFRSSKRFDHLDIELVSKIRTAIEKIINHE